MTKQEEIREGIGEIVYRQTMVLLGADFPEEYKPKTMYGKVGADKILQYLHDNDVVIQSKEAEFHHGYFPKVESLITPE